MHFCFICIYSIKYLISGKCDLDPVAKPQQASNHTIVLVRVKPSKICHIAHVLMKFECSIKYFYIHLNGCFLVKRVSCLQGWVIAAMSDLSSARCPDILCFISYWLPWWFSACW